MLQHMQQHWAVGWKCMTQKQRTNISWMSEGGNVGPKLGESEARIKKKLVSKICRSVPVYLKSFSIIRFEVKGTFSWIDVMAAIWKVLIYQIWNDGALTFFEDHRAKKDTQEKTTTRWVAIWDKFLIQKQSALPHAGMRLISITLNLIYCIYVNILFLPTIPGPSHCQFLLP